jgi:release factor glutamine methyltransferase
LQTSIPSILKADTATLAHKLALDPSTARIEIQSLLQQVLQVARVYLLAHPERTLTAVELSEYQDLLQRRLQGEPLAYILGVREFYGINFNVTPATLIPRPDTELLVELALQHLPAQLACSVLDLGTGSGAIALAIAQNRPRADVVACDASSAALLVAQENACALNSQNVQFLQSNWYSELAAQRYTLIVSNPPYIATADPHLTQGDVRFEPISALTSGNDGLDDIRHIIRHAHAHLLDCGWLLLEHGYDQAARVRELLKLADFQEVFSACDLAGIERVSGGRLAF